MKADYVSHRGSSCGRSAAAEPPSVSISLNEPAAAVVVKVIGAGLRVTTGSGSQNKRSGFSRMGSRSPRHMSAALPALLQLLLRLVLRRDRLGVAMSG